MKFWPRIRSASQPGPAIAPSLRAIRRPVRSFETLESRMLLSDATPTPKPFVDLTANLVKVEAYYPTLVEPSSAVVGPSSQTTTATGLQDDWFALAPSAATPAVRVDLLLAPDQTNANGQLLVSSGAGQLLYRVPLANVEALHAELPIPTDPATTPSTLGIDLLVTHQSAGPAIPGLIHLAIYWNDEIPANDPFPRQQPQNLNSPVSGSPVLGPVVSSPSLFGVSYSPWVATVLSMPSFGPTMGSTDGVTSGPTSSDDPSDLIGRTPIAPIRPGPSSESQSGSADPRSSGLIGLYPTDRSTASGTPLPPIRSANVGPLPLSGPTPDGGIFAHPNRKQSDAENGLQTNLTVELEPVIEPEKKVEKPIDHVSADPLLPLPVPFVLVRRKLPVALKSDVELSSEASASGPFLLPQLADLSNAAGPVRSQASDRESEIQSVGRRPDASLRIGPSIAGVLVSAVSLFCCLIGPDCESSLAAWRKEGRSIGRRFESRPGSGLDR